jgi:hypothetical protein
MTSLVLSLFYYLYFLILVYGKYLVIVLVIFLLLLVAGRIWLMLQVVKGENCPQCHGVKFMRIHRRWYERILGYGMKARRYRCENPDCEWEGLRRHTKRGV